MVGKGLVFLLLQDTRGQSEAVKRGGQA